MALVQGFFDESASGDGQQIFCVAGYLVDSAQIEPASREWEEVLAEYGVKFFHMKDCGPFKNPYKSLTEEQRVSLVKRLIEIIKARTLFGVAVSINIAHFKNGALGQKLQFRGRNLNHYEFAVYQLFLNIARVMTDNKADADIIYNFESGYHLQKSAESLIRELVSEPFEENPYRYAGHAFFPKNGSVLLQAADLLAWQATKRLKELAHKRRGQRADFTNLLEHEHYLVNVFERNGVCVVARESRDAEQNQADQFSLYDALHNLHSGRDPEGRPLSGLLFENGIFRQVTLD